MAYQLSEREQKYDRQLRLWGAEGQKKLESTHICILGSGPAATETLKNLVLPGLGSFTIVDDAILTERDLANNFFVTEQDLNSPRASVTEKWLKELNPDVRFTSSIVKNSSVYVRENPDFIVNYDLVVVADGLCQEDLLGVASSCEKHKVPLFIVRSYGFIGYLRIQLPDWHVIESKSDFSIFDMRFSNPFPEFLEYVNKFNFDTMNSREFANVPFPVILIHALRIWCKKNKLSPNTLPGTVEEKKAYREIITNISKSEQENFVEAYNNASKVYIPYSIPSEVQRILENPRATGIDRNSSDFWIVVAAIRRFVENEGQGKLPLSGHIPDMTAETVVFIEIKNIYLKKAQMDCDVVIRYVDIILKEIGLDREIPSEYISFVCKNVNSLRFFTYRTLGDEYKCEPKENWLKNAETTGKDNHLTWYLLLRAADNYKAKYSSYPGDDINLNISSYFDKYKSCLDEILLNYSIPLDFVEKKDIEEFIRFSASQLHSICSILGGLSAQEVLKVITRQWMPLVNTFIFDGVNSTSASYDM